MSNTSINPTAAFLLYALALLVATSGCMMAPLRPELPLLDDDLSIHSSDPNGVKLVLLNNSNKWMYGLDRTGRVNIWLDGKAVAGPDIGEYVQLQIPKGKHQLELVHLDVTKHRSIHEIDAQTSPLFVELRATPLSNKIRLHDEMPQGEFRPMAAHLD
jgi:hypothetical protein